MAAIHILSLKGTVEAAQYASVYHIFSVPFLQLLKIASQPQRLLPYYKEKSITV